MVFGSLACACALGAAGTRNRSGFRKTSSAEPCALYSETGSNTPADTKLHGPVWLP